MVAKAMEQLTAVRDGEPLSSAPKQKKGKQNKKKKDMADEEVKKEVDTGNIRTVTNLNKQQQQDATEQ